MWSSARRAMKHRRARRQAVAPAEEAALLQVIRGVDRLRAEVTRRPRDAPGDHQRGERPGVASVGGDSPRAAASATAAGACIQRKAEPMYSHAPRGRDGVGRRPHRQREEQRRARERPREVARARQRCERDQPRRGARRGGRVADGGPVRQRWPSSPRSTSSTPGPAVTSTTASPARRPRRFASRGAAAPRASRGPRSGTVATGAPTRGVDPDRERRSRRRRPGTTARAFAHAATREVAVREGPRRGARAERPAARSTTRSPTRGPAEGGRAARFVTTDREPRGAGRAGIARRGPTRPRARAPREALRGEHREVGRRGREARGRLEELGEARAVGLRRGPTRPTSGPGRSGGRSRGGP